MIIETAQQWDDEWWRLWEGARAAGEDGEAAAARADLEMSERHSPRPDDPLPLRGFRLDRLDDLLAEIKKIDELPPFEVDNSAEQFVSRSPGRPTIQGFHPDAVIIDEVADWMANGGPVELDPWQAEALLTQADVGVCTHPRRGWLGRLLDRMFG